MDISHKIVYMVANFYFQKNKKTKRLETTSMLKVKVKTIGWTTKSIMPVQLL